MRHLLKKLGRRWQKWRKQKHIAPWDIHGKPLLTEFVKDRRKGDGPLW
jgi:hypothetical protein